jgi:hypothetical protein
MRRMIVWWLAGNAVGLVLAVCLPGRASANAHPAVRGGGDWGFGGCERMEDER